MTSVEILFSGVSEVKKLIAFQKLLQQFNLPEISDQSYAILTYEEVKYAFKYAQEEYNNQQNTFMPNHSKEHVILFKTLSDTNPNMFIAVIKAIVHDKYFVYFCFGLLMTKKYYYLPSSVKHYIGWNSNKILCEDDENDELIISVYKRLLNYYNFSVEGLTLPDECKKQIERYSEEKNNGKFTKPAKKK